jgi:predicted DNA-binding transcriptional regulator AlpA
MGPAEIPELVGAKAASEILGVPDSRIARLRRQGRMPKGVPIKGSKADAYVRAEVEVLARELERERKARGK